MQKNLRYLPQSAINLLLVFSLRKDKDNVHENKSRHVKQQARRRSQAKVKASLSAG